MERALEMWAESLALRERQGLPAPQDHVYAFAYWLFRWSGLLDIPEAE